VPETKEPSKPNKLPPPVPFEVENPQVDNELPQDEPTDGEVKPSKPNKLPPPVPVEITDATPQVVNYDSLIEGTHSYLEKGKFRDALKEITSAIEWLSKFIKTIFY
jgi:hypothetical protein